jgi:hypothetical protein
MKPDAWLDPIEAALAKLMKKGKTVDGIFDGEHSDKDGVLEWRVGSDYLLRQVLEIDQRWLHNGHTNHLGAVMLSLGWTRNSHPMRIGSKQVRGFVKSQGPRQLEGPSVPTVVVPRLIRRA